jgi:hypothetical protein
VTQTKQPPINPERFTLWASENFEAFIVFRSSQPRENNAENSNSERPSFRGADHLRSPP